MVRDRGRINDLFGGGSEDLPVAESKHDSGFLMDTGDHFVRWSMSTSVDLVCFYETQKTNYGLGALKVSELASTSISCELLSVMLNAL